MTWRRLGLLVRHLPRESVFVRAVAGPAADWGHTEHLLAAVVDCIQAGNYQRAKAHFKGSPTMPKPLPRPGVADASSDRKFGTGRYTIAQMDEILANWSDHVIEAQAVEEVR